MAEPPAEGQIQRAEEPRTARRDVGRPPRLKLKRIWALCRYLYAAHSAAP